MGGVSAVVRRRTTPSPDSRSRSEAMIAESAEVARKARFAAAERRIGFENDHFLLAEEDLEVDESIARSRAIARYNDKLEARLNITLDRVREAASSLQTHVMTADQVGQIMMSIPESCQRARADVLVMMYGKIKDIENLYDICDPPELNEEMCEEVINRLGWLNVFNPLKPDHQFNLNMKWRDHRVLAEILVELAVVEPGENLQDQRYRWKPDSDWIPGWDVPESWVREIPQTGILQTRYYSGKDKGCKPDWHLRQKLLRKVLMGSRVDDD